MKRMISGIVAAVFTVVISITASAAGINIDGKLTEKDWANAKYSVVLQSPSAGVQFAEFYYFLSGNDFYFGANWIDTGDGSGAGGIQIYFADGFGPVLRPGIAYNGELNLTHKIVVQRGTDYTLEGRLTLPDNQISNLSQLAVCIIGKTGGIAPRSYISTGITTPVPTTSKPASGGDSGSKTTTRTPSGGSQTTTKPNSNQGGGANGQAGNDNRGGYSDGSNNGTSTPNNEGTPNAPAGEPLTNSAGGITNDEREKEGNTGLWIVLSIGVCGVILLSIGFAFVRHGLKKREL